MKKIIIEDEKSAVKYLNFVLTEWTTFCETHTNITQAIEVLLNVLQTKNESLIIEREYIKEVKALNKELINYETPSGKHTMPNIVSLDRDVTRVYTQIENEIKADTVKKMQELFNKRVKNPFSYHGWYLKETIFPEIAKEMLGDK